MSRAWRMPALLALASIGGLVGALVGDGAWDALSWGLLALPLLAALGAARR